MWSSALEISSYWAETAEWPNAQINLKGTNEEFAPAAPVAHSHWDTVTDGACPRICSGAIAMQFPLPGCPGKPGKQERMNRNS